MTTKTASFGIFISLILLSVIFIMAFNFRLGIYYILPSSSTINASHRLSGTHVDTFATSAKKSQYKINIPKPAKSQNEHGRLDIYENKIKNEENQKSNTNVKLQNLRPRIPTDYQKLHDKLCKNSWQKGYTKLHHDLLESGQNRYLVYSCSGGGWGNRLRDIISSFHFAVISKRAFILICDHPSPLDALLLSPHIKWNYKVNMTGLSIRKNHKIAISTLENQADLSMLNKLLNYSVEYTPKLVGNYHQFLAKNLKYDLPVWPNLVQVMGCSFYYLFKKSESLQKRIDQWKEQLGFNENIVLGIHIREGDTVFKHNQGDKRIDKTGIDFSFDCAAQMEKSIQTKYNDTKNIIWFLAADSEKMKNYATQKFGKKVKHITGPIEHVGHPSSKENAEAGHSTMFLDYFLLQESDYRLYTGPSTFDNAVNFITFGKNQAGYSYDRPNVHNCRIPNDLKRYR